MNWQLKRNSKLVRWAYLFESRREYTVRTSLCAIFWRSVLFTPLKLFSIGLLGAFCCFLMFLYGRLWWQHWTVAVLRTLGVIGAAAFLLFMVWVTGSHTDLAIYAEKHPLIQGALAVKRKICPIVDIVD